MVAQERRAGQQEEHSTPSTSPRKTRLLKAGRRCRSARGWKVSEEKNEWYKKALDREGHEDHDRRRAKLVADLKQVGATMLADWEKKAGPDGRGRDHGLPQEVTPH